MSATALWARTELRRRWVALVLLSLVVALAGGVTIAAAAGAKRTDAAFPRFIERVGAPNVVVSWNFEGDFPEDGFASEIRPVFDQAVLLDGVRSAQQFVLWAVSPDPSLAAFQFGLLESGGRATRPFVVDGDLPDPSSATELTMNEYASSLLGAGAGDEIPLYTVAPAQLEEWGSSNAAVDEFLGPMVPMTVGAITRDAEDIAQAEDPLLTLMPGFYERYHDEIINCLCFAGFEVAEAKVDDVIDQLNVWYQPLGFFAERTEGGQLPEQAGRAIDVEVRSLQLVALAAGVAGLLVLAQAMLRQAADLALDGPVRRAIGMTRGQLVLDSAMLLVPAALVGTLGALGVAALLSPLTPRGLARDTIAQGGVHLERSVVISGMAVLFLVSVLLAVVAASYGTGSARQPRPARATLRSGVSPAAALGVAFTTQPGPRQRSAVTTAVMAVASATVAVLAVWSFEASRHHGLSTPRLFGVDADIGWGGGTDSQLAAASDAAADDPGVEAAVTRYEFSTEGDVATVAAGPTGEVNVDPSTHVPLKGTITSTLVRGRFPEGSLEVAIGRAEMSATGVSLGETLHVTNTEGTTSTVTVVGLVVSYGVDDAEHAFELTEDGFATLTRLECAPTINVADCNHEIAVRLEQGDAGAAAARHLEALGFAPLAVPSVIGNLSAVGPAPMALALFLGVLGVAALAHALVLAVRRRRRDVAIARSLGFTPADARAVVRWHAVTLAGIGIVIGVPVGFVVGRAVWQATAHSVGAIVEHALPWWAIPVVAAAAVAVSIVVVEPLARRIGKVRPAEGLRSE